MGLDEVSIVGVSLTVDDEKWDPRIKKPTGVPTPEQSNVLLWTGTTEKLILAT